MRPLRTTACLLVFAALAAGTAFAQQKYKVDGYAEWRSRDTIIVDGQRVQVNERTRFTDARWSAIEAGYEMKAEGVRQPDGSILASSVTAKPNGASLFEEDAIREADDVEQEWLEAGKIPADEESGDPAMRIIRRGRSVDRVRALVDRLVPPYLDPGDFRVYVVENTDWNAFAMANGSVWVYTGILADMSDDELAIVIGHELVHVTHEHIRRSMKKDMWYGLVQAGVGLLTESDAAAIVAGGLSLVRTNKFSRDLEDQADRVGLRYAYEAGFDTTTAPRLWRRFDEKYGSEDKVTNFLFGDHSRSVDRVRKLDTQIALNYRDGAGGRTRTGDGASDGMTTKRKPTRRGAYKAAPHQAGAQAGSAATRDLGDALVALKAGMSQDEVTRVMGAPLSVDRDGAQTVLQYGDEIDVVLADGRLVKIRPRQ